MSDTKRTLDKAGEAEPESKRPALEGEAMPASAADTLAPAATPAAAPAPAACSWGGASAACSSSCSSTGGFGSVSGGSFGSASSGGFGSVTGSGFGSFGAGGAGGFGAVAAAAAASTSGFGAASSAPSAAAGTSGSGGSSFGSFGGPREPAPRTTFAAASPHGARSGGGGASSASNGRAETPAEAPVLVPEPVTTGEEDEICVYRVRAKLFRLELRLEPAPKNCPASALRAAADLDPADESAGSPANAPSPAAEGAAPAPSAQYGANGSAGTDAGAGAAPVTAPSAPDGAAVGAPVTALPVSSSSSTLNPHAAPFVPSAAGATSAAIGKGTMSAGAAGRGDDEGNHDDDDEDDDDDDDDDAAGGGDDGASATTKATEANEGPLVEVARWAERGVGSLRLLKHKPLPRGDERQLPYPRLVMRVEQTMRLILNEHLLPLMAPAERVSDCSIRLVLLSAATGPQSYLLRVKSASEATELLTKVNATIPKPPDATA